MLRLSLSSDEEVASELLSDHSVHFVKPASMPSKNPISAYAEAMKSPIDCLSLSEEKSRRPALIFADNTRMSSPLVPMLVEILAEKGDLKLICASGTHKPPSEEHYKAVLGRNLYERFRDSICNSTTKKECSYEPIGHTSRGTSVELNSDLLDRDLIVSSLNVKPHYFAGYEGGCKALLPGCSSLRTILENHSRSIENMKARELIISGNDVREDIDEVSDLLQRTRGPIHRIFDFVLNPDGSTVKAVYGKAPKAHRLLAESYARGIWAVKAESAKLVITVSDGPHGLNLYQALKAASYATNLTTPTQNPKSRILLLASLREGIGGDAFAYEMERYGKWEAPRIMDDLKSRAAAGDITEASQKPNRLALDDTRAELIFVSPSAPAAVETLLAKTKYQLYRSLDEAIRETPRQLLDSVAIIPHGSGTVPISES